MTCTSRGVGEYVASEAHCALYGRAYKTNASQRPIIVFTGGNAGALDFITVTASGSACFLSLGQQAIPLYSADFGGPNLYGNSTAVTRIGQAWTHAKTLLNTKTDKFVGIGISKGATALLNYAKDNLSNVAAIAGILPAVDIQDMYTNDRGGLASAISTAWGGPPPDSGTPARNTSSFTALPMKLWYASNDTTVIPQTVTDFATATGAVTSNMGAVGHNAQTTSATEIASFIAPYL